MRLRCWLRWRNRLPDQGLVGVPGQAALAPSGDPPSGRPETDGLVLALTPAQLALVCEIIDAILPDAEVWVFGSRVTGRARPFSDLDLLFVKPDTLSWAERAALNERFEASELPFRVDLVGAQGLSSTMRSRIEQERVLLRAACATG